MELGQVDLVNLNKALFNEQLMDHCIVISVNVNTTMINHDDINLKNTDVQIILLVLIALLRHVCFSYMVFLKIKA